jgi:crotonobetainyl-CoA:carnitine CoA-transferase CaiB-like acyl-CoA transferase
MALPLTGIRVLDLSHFVAGPFAPTLLAYAGADVIKVEPPEGETPRTFGPLLRGESQRYLAWNPGKRSLAVDLKQPEGREIIERLLPSTDVLVENFREGVMERLGFGYTRLQHQYPQLIYCAVTAYGATGPYAHKPGFDPLAQALSGIMAQHGGSGNPPKYYLGAPTDYACAILAAYGIALALFARRRTGRGQRVDTSLLNTAVAMQAGAFLRAVDSKTLAAASGLVPYQVFATVDRWMFVGIETDGQWQQLCHVLDLPALGADARFRSNADRVAGRDVLVPPLAARFQTRSAREWLSRLEAVNIPCAPVQSLKEVEADPRLLEAGWHTRVQHPAVGLLRMLSSPVHFSAEPSPAYLPAPLLGQHTEAILQELGYTAEDLSDLRAKRVVV